MITKVLNNRRKFTEKSFIFNLIFDLKRNLFGPIAYPLLYFNTIDYERIIELTLITLILSIISQSLLKNKIFIAIPLLVPCITFELMLFYAYTLITTLNNIENIVNGNAFRSIILIYLEYHLSL